MTEIKQTHLNKLVLLHRFLIIIFVSGLLLYLFWYDTKPTLHFNLTPQKQDLLRKRFTTPNDSPVIDWQGRRVWLINQPSTPFTFTLTDIFDDISIKIWYRSPIPHKLSISSDKSRTPFLIDPDQVSIYKRLEERGWRATPDILGDYPELVLFTNPGKPSFFKPFEYFWNQLDAARTVERIYSQPSILVVLNDQNTQLQPLPDQHKLNFIQYVLLPRSLDIYAQHGIRFTQKVQQSQQGDLYQLEFSENLWEKVRKRGAKYKFYINLDNYQPGNWAIVEKIEITATRQPVTVESFKNFLRKQFKLL